MHNGTPAFRASLARKWARELAWAGMMAQWGGTAWPVCLVVLGLAQLVHAQAGPGARYNYKSSLVYFLFVLLSKINMNTGTCLSSQDRIILDHEISSSILN